MKVILNAKLEFLISDFLSFNTAAFDIAGSTIVVSAVTIISGTPIKVLYLYKRPFKDAD